MFRRYTAIYCSLLPCFYTACFITDLVLTMHLVFSAVHIALCCHFTATVLYGATCHYSHDYRHIPSNHTVNTVYRGNPIVSLLSVTVLLIVLYIYALLHPMTKKRGILSLTLLLLSFFM